MTKQFLMRLGRKDRERLEMIRAAYGVSMAAAVRIAVKQISERLGIEKKGGELLEKNNM